MREKYGRVYGEFAKNKVTDETYTILCETKNGLKLQNIKTGMVFILTINCFDFFEFTVAEGGA